MIYTIIKSKNKHLNLKRIQYLLKWFKIPIRLISINLKWLFAKIGYNNSPNNYLRQRIRVVGYFSNKCILIEFTIPNLSKSVCKISIEYKITFWICVCMFRNLQKIFVVKKQYLILVLKHVHGMQNKIFFDKIIVEEKK